MMNADSVSKKKYANWKLLPVEFQTLVMDPKIKTSLFGRL